MTRQPKTDSGDRKSFALAVSLTLLILGSMATEGLAADSKHKPKTVQTSPSNIKIPSDVKAPMDLDAKPPVPAAPDLDEVWVPKGADAHYYFALGLQYKNNGWVERARKVLQKATLMDPNSIAGNSARVFLSVAIPKKSISDEAVQQNIEAFNLNASGDRQNAMTKFKQVISSFPEFEWPYGNLASIYIEEKKLLEADTLVDKALALNPCYINAVRYKITILRAQGKDGEAEKLIAKALECLGPIDKLERPLIILYKQVESLSRRPKPDAMT